MNRPPINKARVARWLVQHYGATNDTNISSAEQTLANKTSTYIDRQSRRGTKRPGGNDVVPEPKRTRKSPTPSRDSTEFGQLPTSIRHMSPILNASPVHAETSREGNSSAHSPVRSSTGSLEPTLNSPRSVSAPLPPTANEFDPSQLEFESPVVSEPNQNGPNGQPIAKKIRRHKPAFTFEIYKRMLENVKLIDSPDLKVFIATRFQRDCKSIHNDLGANRAKIGKSAIQTLEKAGNHLVRSLLKNMTLRAHFEGKSLGTTRRKMVQETLCLWQLEERDLFANFHI